MENLESFCEGKNNVRLNNIQINEKENLIETLNSGER
jgi:hypothetical protein